jgi:AraC-like DNA-binding protein
MSKLYSWPQIEKNMFVRMGCDIFVQHTKSLNAGNASYHHYHEVFELYYLYEGDRSYYIEGKTHRIARGSFVLIRPGAIHSTGLASPTGYNRYLLYFSRAYLEKLEKNSGLARLSAIFFKDSCVIPVEFSRQGFVESLLRTMLEEFEAPKEGSEQFLAASALQLLLLLNRYRPQAGLGEQNNSDTAHRIVTEAVTHINQHYMNPLTLNEMADRFFISTGYFSHAFKRITGITFIKYVNGIRIKEAQRLLKQDGASVAAVAEAVGFTGTTHFGRVFKEITGQTPMEYKMRGT